MTLLPSSKARKERSLGLTPAEWQAELGEQLEDLLSEIWRCERKARAEDRLELALKSLPDAAREDIQ